MKEMVLIAVGGSGARIAQSVVALAAAGFVDRLVREEARLTIRLVDIDINHADGVELRKLVTSYHNAFRFLWDARCSAERKGWRPIEIVLESDSQFYFGTGFDTGETTYANIQEYLDGYINLSASTMPLIHALYGATDREMELYDGCKGHPHIGSLLWEHLYTERFDPFWNTLVSRTGSPDPARIMFTGSLFGGTGASGVPTLAKCLKESIRPNPDCEIGLTLMAPYFYLHDSPDKEHRADEVEVDFSQFGFQSKLALNYYMLRDVLPDVECIQIVGSPRQSMVGKDGTIVQNEGDDTSNPQNDPAVPAELTAAIGIMRYFAGDWENGVFVPKETTEGKKDWSMFPETDRVRASLQQLERFCLMTRDYFTPIALRGDSALLPTFIAELWKSSLQESDDWESIWRGYAEGIGRVLEFSENMLSWFTEVFRNGLAVLEVDEYSVKLAQKSKRGKTAGINLQGIKGSEILGIMNQQVPFYFSSRTHMDTPNNPNSDAFTLALMDACETPYSRRNGR